MQSSIDNVSKQYTSDVWGLRDFSLELEPGVLGLLGPNGAGKSTLMTIVAALALAQGMPFVYLGLAAALLIAALIGRRRQIRG